LWTKFDPVFSGEKGMKKIGLLMLVLVIALSACSGPTATPQPAATAPANEAVVTAPTAAPTAAPKATDVPPTAVPSPEPVTLRLSAWGSPEQNAPTSAMIAAFMAKYPSITVEEEFDPFDGYWEKKTTQLASDQLPDVFAMSTAYICDYASSGRLADLTSYLVDPEISALVKNLPANAMENLTINGKTIGFPYATGTLVLYYNKTLFDAAGVEYPKAGWTYNDLLAAATKLSVDKNGDGELDQWGFDAGVAGIDIFYGILHSFGGTWFSADGTKSLVNSPESVKAVQFIQDLAYKNKVSPRPQDTEGVDNPFASGLTAMHLGLVGDMSAYKEITDFQWDMAAPALGFNGEKAAGSIRGNPNFVVSAKTAHPYEAALLSAYMAGDEAQTILGQAKGRFPVNPVGQAQYLSAPPDNFNIIIELMKNDVANEPLCINHSADILAAWASILEGEILTNNSTAEQVLPDLSTQIQTLLDTK
jgi:multiple sugar transport system substrate-binding protein